MTAKCFSLFVVSLFFVVSTPAEKSWWRVQTSGIDTNLRAVSAAYTPDPKGVPVPVVWASGSNGVILKSLDEGKTWQRLHVKDGDALDFRGIVAFNESTAYLMSIGEGEKSRIYKTTDGGETWNLQHSDNRKEFFLDTIACRSEKECFALGDPISGKSLLLKTTDGEHWYPLPTENMPPALGSEGAFAASNSCLTLSGDKEIFFATGGPAARVFHSTDGGLTWNVARTPVLQGNPSSGVFSVGFDGDKHLIVLGGDYKVTDNPDRVSAYSTDSGLTWQLAARQPGGFRSAVAHVHEGYWVAIGPTGEDITNDGGIHWKHTDSLNLNAVAGQWDRVGGWCSWHDRPSRQPFQVASFVFEMAAAGNRPSSLGSSSQPTNFLAPGFNWSYSSSFSNFANNLFAEASHVRFTECKSEIQFQFQSRQGPAARSPHLPPRRRRSHCVDRHSPLGAGASRRFLRHPRRNRKAP